MAGNTASLDLTRTELAESGRSKRSATIMATLLLLGDVLALMLAFVLGYFAREVLPFFLIPESQPELSRYLPTMILHILTVVLSLYFARLYHLPRVFSRFDQMRSLVGVVILGAFLAYGMQDFIFRNSFLDVDYPRSMFFYVSFFSLMFVGIWRELHQWLKAFMRRRGWMRDNLLIIGAGRIARDILNRVKNSPELGYNIVGVITSKDEHQGKMLQVPIIANYENISEAIDRHQVAQVIIALPDAQRSELVDMVSQCQRGRVDIKIYPDIFAYMAGDLNVDDLGGTPLLTVRDIALRGWKLSMKRALDIFGAMFGLVFLSPIMLLTAFIIRLESKGAVFYTQERVGMDGRPFPMVKFRSMREDAEKDGPGWTVENDPRVTRVGAFMRRTSWDEIPQLMNVLLGHMSLVGPRPEREVYVQEFRAKIPRYMERHREMVGMTGWAQVHGLRGDTSVEQRTAYDLWYVENWSVWLDVKIIFRTIMQTLLRKENNAY